VKSRGTSITSTTFTRIVPRVPKPDLNAKEKKMVPEGETFRSMLSVIILREKVLLE
jgi:hypothetical protein